MASTSVRELRRLGRNVEEGAALDRRAAELWSTTEILVWEEDFVVVDLPVEARGMVVRALDGIDKPPLALLFEPDQVSLTVSENVWAASGLAPLARQVGGPFSMVTLKQDVGLEVSGYLAPPIQRFAEEGIPIIPHGSYLKEHWVFLKRDLGRAVAILEAHVAAQRALLEHAPRARAVCGETTS